VSLVGLIWALLADGAADVIATLFVAAPLLAMLCLRRVRGQ